MQYTHLNSDGNDSLQEILYTPINILICQVIFYELLTKLPLKSYPQTFGLQVLRLLARNHK